MKKYLITISMILSLMFGCGLLDPIARKVNSPKQFEAEYETWTSSTVTFTQRESDRKFLQVKTKGNKFYIKKYKNFRGMDNLEEEAVCDGKTFWLIQKAMRRNSKDYAVHMKASGKLIRKLSFWKLPPIRLPKPTEETLDGKQYYVYKYKDYGRGGHVEVAFYVDKEDYILKKAETALFISDMVDEPYQVSHLECKSIVFKDIADSTFDYKPAPNAEVKTSAEAIRDGMEAFGKIVSGQVGR